jgi:NMD protein affecting ribosome stability and mRNA decay
MTGDICIRCGNPIEDDDPSCDAEMYTLELSGDGLKHQLEDQICATCAKFYNRQNRLKEAAKPSQTTH